MAWGHAVGAEDEDLAWELLQPAHKPAHIVEQLTRSCMGGQAAKGG